jgi:hypothetical protein
MSPLWIRVLSTALALVTAVSSLTRRRPATSPLDTTAEYPSLETHDYLAE